MAKETSLGKNTHEILLSSAYLPPVQYIAKFLQYQTILIETDENFLKQSYRNRTIILTANGPESLVIPVTKGRDAKKKNERPSNFVRFSLAAYSLAGHYIGLPLVAFF
ncbi:MAG: WbqC family protein [Mangrovibacterium sp.]